MKIGKRLRLAAARASFHLVSPSVRYQHRYRQWLARSGALPTEELPSKIIAVENDEIGAERIAAKFRSASPPILGRIRDGRFLLDLRTIFDPEDLIPGSGGGAVHTS